MVAVASFTCTAQLVCSINCRKLSVRTVCSLYRRESVGHDRRQLVRWIWMETKFQNYKSHDMWHFSPSHYWRVWYDVITTQIKTLLFKRRTRARAPLLARPSACVCVSVYQLLVFTHVEYCVCLHSPDSFSMCVKRTLNASTAYWKTIR